MDSPAPQSDRILVIPAAAKTPQAEIAASVLAELWRDSDGASVDLNQEELANALLTIGTKYNYGLPEGVVARPAQAVLFWRSLELRELALAGACALGRERAWEKFIDTYRQPLTQAAIAITGSGSLGQELADSLYSEMFGLRVSEGERKSPLASYAGRGSLMGFLRTTLAQRYVDYQRSTQKVSAIGEREFAAPATYPVPSEAVIRSLSQSLTTVFLSLDAEERFLLAAWFLNQRTLADIAQVLRVHEATISRKLKRITENLHKKLLEQLRASGMSKRGAEEALGTDPRDIDINLRGLLQSCENSTFFGKGTSAE